MSLVMPKIPDSQFIKLLNEELETSANIVDDHTLAGENALISISEMFPHGEADLLFVLYQKTCRALGYESQGEYEKVRVEAQDILNYAGFLLVFLRYRIVEAS